MGGNGKNRSCMAFLPDDERTVDEKARALFAEHPLCIKRGYRDHCADSANYDMNAAWQSLPRGVRDPAHGRRVSAKSHGLRPTQRAAFSPRRTAKDAGAGLGTLNRL